MSIYRDVERAIEAIRAAPAYPKPEPVAQHPRVLLCQCGANEQAIAYGLGDWLMLIKHDPWCPAKARKPVIPCAWLGNAESAPTQTPKG